MPPRPQRQDAALPRPQRPPPAHPGAHLRRAPGGAAQRRRAGAVGAPVRAGRRPAAAAAVAHLPRPHPRATGKAHRRGGGGGLPRVFVHGGGERGGLLLTCVAVPSCPAPPAPAGVLGGQSLEVLRPFSPAAPRRHPTTHSPLSARAQVLVLRTGDGAGASAGVIDAHTGAEVEQLALPAGVAKVRAVPPPAASPGSRRPRPWSGDDCACAQHGTAQHSTARHSTAQHSTAQHSTAQHSTAQHSAA